MLSSELRDVDGPSHRVISLCELGSDQPLPEGVPPHDSAAAARIEALEAELADAQAALAACQQENRLLSNHLEAAIESAGKLAERPLV